MIEWETTTRVKVTPQILAKLWTEMSVDEQAQFFIEAAKCMAEWSVSQDASYQRFLIGEHLRKCECSSDGARELVADIFQAMSEPVDKLAAAMATIREEGFHCYGDSCAIESAGKRNP